MIELRDTLRKFVAERDWDPFHSPSAPPPQSPGDHTIPSSLNFKYNSLHAHASVAA